MAIDEEAYPSADALLQYSYKEYEYEFDRRNTLDTKSRLLVTVFISLLTFYLSSQDFSLIRNTDGNFRIFCFLLFFIVSSLSIISLISLFYSLRLNGYKRLNPSSLASEIIAEQSCNRTKLNICKVVAKYCEYNERVNNKKAKTYHKALVLAFITVVVIIFSFLFTNLLINKEEEECAKVVTQKQVLVVTLNRK